MTRTEIDALMNYLSRIAAAIERIADSMDKSTSLFEFDEDELLDDSVLIRYEGTDGDANT